MQAPLSGSSLIGVGAPAQERNFSLFLSPPSFSQPEVTNNVVPIPDFVCTNSQHRSFSGRIYVDLTPRIDICPLVEYEFDQDNDVMVYLAEQTWTELANHFATPPPAPALSIEGLRFTDRQLADFCQAFAENVTFKVDADFPYVSVMVNGQGTHASVGQSSFRTISTSRSSMVQRYVFFSRD